MTTQLVSPEFNDWQNRATSALLSLNSFSLTVVYENSGLAMVSFAEKILVPVLDAIGDRWQKGELSLAQVYMGSRMCEQLMLAHADTNDSEPKDHGIAIAVLEDFHVLGKQLVNAVMHTAGYAFLDYDRMPLDDLFERALNDNVKILLISTLMLSSALRVKELKNRFVSVGRDVRLVVGGAPFRFDPDLWHQVGADASTPSASGVIAIIQSMTGEVAHGNV